VDITKENEVLKEYKNFVTDICYDYKDKPELGLMAIRVLSKGKQDDRSFRQVWLRWRENMGLPVPSDKEEKDYV